MPEIDLLAENNCRTGFFERREYEAVRRHLPEDLWAVITVAYITGWRVRSEILTREWRHVDFENGWLRLDPGEAKSDEPRNFPLTPELRSVLERQREHTDAVEQAQHRIVRHVFHRNGKAIRSLHCAWQRACRDAGVPGRILHDFRRTAVRNLEMSGVPRTAAMAMVGHKTESIYRRYGIVDAGMLRAAGARLAAFHQQQSR